jgi:hypothetical protein
VKGKVVDADYIDVTDDYIITAKDISMTISESQMAGALEDAGLINRSEATGYVRADLSDTGVAVTGREDIPNPGSTGTGKATYAVALAPAVNVTGNVSVTEGQKPKLTVTPNPHEVEINSAPTYNYDLGVSATDEEDDRDGKPISITHTGSVDMAADGVYTLVYTATDSDGNEDMVTRIVVVNDGTYTVTGSYILRARGFVIKGTDVKANDEAHVLAKAEAAAWNAKTGQSVDAVVTDFGGYSSAEDVYDINIAVDLNRSVESAIKAEVISQTILEKIDGYYIAGDPVKMNSTTDKTAPDLVKLANVRGWKDAPSLPSKAVQLDSYTGSFDGTPGTFHATFSVVEHPATKLTNVPVLVDDGQKPTLDFELLQVAPGTDPKDFDPLDGVTAHDLEDDRDGKELKPTCPNKSAVDLDTEGVYIVTISVTDSDYNTTTKPRVIVVGLTVGDRYILGAENFSIHEDSVDVSSVENRDAQIFSAAQTRVWLLDGTPVADPTTLKVVSDGGYTNAARKAPYPITIGFTDDTLEKGIKAAVYSGHIVPGDEYDLYYDDFAISVAEAKTVIGTNQDTDASHTKLIGWGNAYAIKKADFTLVDNGVQVDSYDIEADASKTWHVTYSVAAETKTKGTADVSVIEGSAPTLTVPPVNIVSVGAICEDGAWADDPKTVPSYRGGVSANDDEDGDITDSVNYNKLVNTTNEAVFTVKYDVTDEDSNTVTKSGLVLVGDDWKVVSGYAISAHEFTKRTSQVTGTSQEAISYSDATAIDVRPEIDDPENQGEMIENPNFGEEVYVIVKDLDGYKAATGAYDITYAVKDEPEADITRTAAVTRGVPPVLTVPKTRIVPIGSEFNYMQGVTAVDLEDGVITYTVTYNTPVNTNSPGVYTVTYRVSDNDGNTVQKTGVVLVGTGWVLNDEYALYAEDFARKLSEITGTGSEAMQLANAKAVWIGDSENHNFGVSVQVTIADLGGYRKAEGNYDITFAVASDTSVKKTIRASIGDDAPIDPPSVLPPNPPTINVIPPVLPAPQTTVNVNTPAPTTEVVAKEPVETPIAKAQTPLVNPPFEKSIHWHLLDLLLAGASLIIGLYLMLLAMRRKDDKASQDDKRSRKLKTCGIIGILLGIVAIIMLLITQDFSGTMRWLDMWVLLFAAIFATELLTLIVAGRKKHDEQEAEFGI